MNISSSVFSTISFLSVVAVSVDRFLAVQLHLRYQELVTHKRVVVVVIFIWVSRAFVSLMILWESRVTRDFLISFTAAFAFMLTLVAYVRIYLTVRRHKNQMQSVEYTKKVCPVKKQNLLPSLDLQLVYSTYISCFYFVICLF